MRPASVNEGPVFLLQGTPESPTDQVSSPAVRLRQREPSPSVQSFRSHLVWLNRLRWYLTDTPRSLSTLSILFPPHQRHSAKFGAGPKIYLPYRRVGVSVVERRGTAPRSRSVLRYEELRVL